MSAHVIQFETRRPQNPGNGAREALIAIALTFPSISQEDAVKWTDRMLMECWDKGFKVVPLDIED